MNKLLLENGTKLKRRNLNSFFWLAVFLAAPLLGFSDNYSVNKTASKVNWEAKKVTGKHDGTIGFENGSLLISGSKITGGELIIDMKTIACTDITDAGMNKKFVGHLWSDDFFSVEKFGTSKLNLKKVESKSGDLYHFVGDLTIKGITKPIEFDAAVKVVGGKLTATGVMTVNRALYEIKYGSGSFFSDLGDRMIYDDFTLSFELVADKK